MVALSTMTLCSRRFRFLTRPHSGTVLLAGVCFSSFFPLRCLVRGGRPPPLCRAWHKAEQGRAEGAKARVTARAPCGAVLAHVTGLPSHQQPASPPEATSLFSVGALPPPSLPSSIPPPPSPARHIASMAVRGGGMGKTSTRDRRLRGGRGGGNERSGRQVLEAIHCAKPRPWVRQRVCSSAGRR